MNFTNLFLILIFGSNLMHSMQLERAYQTLLGPELVAHHLMPYIIYNNQDDDLESALHTCLEAAELLDNEAVNGHMLNLCADKYNERNSFIAPVGMKGRQPKKEDLLVTIALGLNTPGAMKYAAQKYPGDVLVALLKEKKFHAVKTFISNSVDPNSFTQDGNALLIGAAWENYSDLVEFLLVHKADPNIKNVIGATPLAATAVLRCEQSAKILLEHGADVDQLCYDDEGTPLMVAIDRVTCTTDYVGFVRLLLAYSPDLTIVDTNGLSALDHAKRLKSSYNEGSAGNQYEKKQIATTMGLLEESWNQTPAASFLHKALQTHNKNTLTDYLQKVTHL